MWVDKHDRSKLRPGNDENEKGENSLEDEDSADDDKSQPAKDEIKMIKIGGTGDFNVRVHDSTKRIYAHLYWAL